MKQAFLATFLAIGMCAMAQTPSSSDSMNHDTKAGRKTTLTGCIAEKDGKYVLTNAQHADGVELATSEDLKAHVGHKVRVTGTMGSAMATDDKMGHDSMSKDDKMGHDAMAKNDSMSHDSMAKDDKMGHDSMAKDDSMSHDSMAKDDKMGHDAMGHDAMGHGSSNAFNVSKFEMRSATCDAKK